MPRAGPSWGPFSFPLHPPKRRLALVAAFPDEPRERDHAARIEPRFTAR